MKETKRGRGSDVKKKEEYTVAGIGMCNAAQYPIPRGGPCIPLKFTMVRDLNQSEPAGSYNVINLLYVFLAACCAELNSHTAVFAISTILTSFCASNALLQ